MEADPSAKSAGLPPVMPGIFNWPEGGAPSLSGGHCPACDRYFFPRPSYCPGCLGRADEAEVGNSGVIYSYTVVRTRAPLGLPEPYPVGYVDLDQTGLRVFSLLDPEAIGRLRLGLPVKLAVKPLGHDLFGSPCLRPLFTPKD
ncbi:MAG: OB-fold domain-containing protein [Thermodesulfobacteriota bacterium]